MLIGKIIILSSTIKEEWLINLIMIRKMWSLSKEWMACGLWTLCWATSILGKSPEKNVS